MRVLVCVASKHGATLGIGIAISRRLGEHGFQVEECLPSTVSSLDEYQAVVLGSALYSNRMMPSMTAFADRWGDTLAQLQTYLFISGPFELGVVDDLPLPKDARDLAASIGAREVRLFAGRLVPSELRATERAVMRMIGARAGDYRDFAAIERWADQIALGMSALPLGYS